VIRGAGSLRWNHRALRERMQLRDVAMVRRLRMRSGMRAFTLLVVLAVASATADADRAKQVRYVGMHPIPKAAGGGLCDIEGPHVHIYAADKLQYREHDGAYFFVGDPTAYGYKGTRYAYKGNHPVHVDLVVGGEPDVEFCYLEGPHYHAFAPPEGELVLTGGAYFYTATPPKAYYAARPSMIQINAIYTPLVYARPVVTVAAPANWIGLRIDVSPPVVVYDIVPVVYVERHYKYKRHKH
jgi:hypothetical protein